jgi:hypothetical protein
VSARALNWAWAQQPKTSTEKLVLVAIADRSDDDGISFPSIGWLVEKCQPISEPTVKRSVASLATQGLIEKTKRLRRRNGDFSTWLYRLPLEEGAEITGDPCAEIAGELCAEITGDLAETFTTNRKSSPDGEDAPASRRKRDEVWDLLVELFGPVAERTNAHAKRNKAVADLKRLGATVETIRAGARAWPKLFEGATLTDVALATHYPQMAQAAGVKDGEVRQVESCAECGVGGGLHLADCSLAKPIEKLAAAA